MGANKILDILFQRLILVVGIIYKLPILDSLFLDVLDLVMELHERFELGYLGDLVPYVLCLLLLFLVVLLFVGLAHGKVMIEGRGIDGVMIMGDDNCNY